MGRHIFSWRQRAWQLGSFGVHATVDGGTSRRKWVNGKAEVSMQLGLQAVVFSRSFAWLEEEGGGRGGSCGT